ncbi:unnamed protein product, partial [marine sediment metagenome]
VNVVYTVVPVSANSCLGEPEVITVTIKSEPVGADDTDNACSDEVLNYDLQANVNAVNGQSSDFS